MFYALAAGKIGTGERRYEHELADIETLNQRALRGELDVTAVSIHAFAHLIDRYALLPHGGSVGDGYGPCLVGREPAPTDPRRTTASKRVAIPGPLTTAALALTLYQPDAATVVVPFDAIEDAVASGDVELGLLIHEGQLTHADRGLHLWADLGAWWHAETTLPLPLGGNAIRRDLGPDLIAAVSEDLRTSIVYGLEHREEALSYAMDFARDLNRSQADRFVGMYVNEFTVEYGARGRRAIHTLLERGAAAGIVPSVTAPLFADDGAA
jgi:1,4-dihydroxy-6-naphthoate synthase